PTATPGNYLPIAPAASAAQLWQDVPAAHFQDPAWWLHRTKLKQLYGIQERSYFRWLQKLQAQGLSRFLPAQQDQKIKLFYRPDVERAVANLSATQPHLGRPAQVTSPRPDAVHTAQISPPQLAPAQLTSLQDQIATINAKQDNQAQAINTLNNQLDQLNAKLALLTTPAATAQAAEALPRALEIIAQALDFNKLNAQ